MGFPGGVVVKNLPANAGDPGDSGSTPGQEGPLEEEMATHSSILSWRIPWGCKESDMTERLTLSLVKPKVCSSVENNKPMLVSWL